MFVTAIPWLGACPKHSAGNAKTHQPARLPSQKIQVALPVATTLSNSPSFTPRPARPSCRTLPRGVPPPPTPKDTSSLPLA
eukprot:9098646-Alexandrium_andersonii.AAC.1